MTLLWFPLNLDDKGRQRRYDERGFPIKRRDNLKGRGFPIYLDSKGFPFREMQWFLIKDKRRYPINIHRLVPLTLHDFAFLLGQEIARKRGEGELKRSDII